MPDNLQLQLKIATLYELTREAAKAEQYYQLAKETNQPPAVIAYAAFLARNGQKDKSLELLRAGYTSHPDNQSIMLALGAELQRQEQFDEAIKTYIHLEETFPGKGLAPAD